jgi:hypothetical protein
MGRQSEASRSIEEGFLDCASRLLRRSEAEKKKRRLASLGMTGLGYLLSDCQDQAMNRIGRER